MICPKCLETFHESEIQESHDVPCYLWFNLITRNERKNEADKWGRHHLCKKCHKEYEEELNLFLRMKAKEFSRRWFNG